MLDRTRSPSKSASRSPRLHSPSHTSHRLPQSKQDSCPLNTNANAAWRLCKRARYRFALSDPIPYFIRSSLRETVQPFHVPIHRGPSQYDCLCILIRQGHLTRLSAGYQGLCLQQIRRDLGVHSRLGGTRPALSTWRNADQHIHVCNHLPAHAG